MIAANGIFRSWTALEHAWGGPVLQAGFKQAPADFLVEEELGFEPDGAGEHLFLQIEKTGLGTAEAQTLLSRHFKLHPRNIAFAGMKDKQGITRQWFSVHASPGATADTVLQHPQMRILRAVRNSRKLRRGTHKGNRFRITLRNPIGDVAACAARLATIAAQGVPNYFGSQRFGHGEQNPVKALAWFRGQTSPGRQERSLYLSAARSYLFNAVLSERVATGSWNGWIDGDVMALCGTGSTFAAEKATAAELHRRLQEFDLHATGPLWGRGQPQVTGAALALELLRVREHPELAAGLEAHGLEQERRPLRLQVQNLQTTFDSDMLVIEFSLVRGAYATAVLREVVTTENR